MRTDVAVLNPDARHPIRRMVAPPPPPAPAPAAKSRDDDDLKLFALSFTAFFICIYSLIY